MGLTIVRFTRRDYLGRRRWYWRVQAGNGEIVAASEAYNSAEAARHGYELLLGHGLEARITDAD